MKIYLSTFTLFIFLFSNNGFSQWIQQNSGTQKLLINVHFVNKYTGWACGRDGTILKTTNGGIEWVSKNIGTLDDIHAIFFIDSLKGWAVLYEFSPFRHASIIHTTDGGNSWNVQLSISDYLFFSIHFTNELTGWVAGSNGIVFHTTNGGLTWLQQYPPIGVGWLVPIFFIDDNIGWTAGDPLFGFFKSTNGGLTWSTVYVPVIERIYSIIFMDENIGWLAATQGQIAISIDGGINWQIQQSGTLQDLRDIHFINSNTGWCVGFGGTILYTTDGGSNWYQQNGGVNFDLFAIDFIDDVTGWAVGDNGVILKTNNGGIPVELINFSSQQLESEVVLEWTTATETNNSGFEIERKSKTQDWLKICFVPGHGTTTEKQNYRLMDKPEDSGEYVYRLKQIDFDGTFEYSNEVNIEFIQQFTFTLEQNYPNPFNPTTTIIFSIPERAVVTLLVYNTLGEVVSELVNEEKEAGRYELDFDASYLPSGIYLYSLVTGNYRETKKLVLVK